jgi:predicted aldo/keto reductase-like oxidoreductase
MNDRSSRRRFLATGLTLPVAGMASVTSSSSTAVEPASALQGGSGLTYRTLGKTGLKVTSVGFGCMITSDQSVVERGADIGITYFDTARSYQGGNNERMVGAALKGKRKNLVLSTKTGAKNKQGALEHLDTSLKELGTDYIDIWYLHGKGSITDVTDDLIDAQQTAKQAGKIRFAGVSTHSGQAELIPALVKTGKIDVILSAYNFTLEPNVTEAINAASKAGVGIVAMKVMAGGFRRLQPGDKTTEILKRPGAMLAALKWVLANPNVGTTIPSMTDMDQLDENLKAMTQSLSESDKKTLAAQLDYIRPLYCRTCGECDGKCAQGLPVADVLRYLMYADGYGQFALGREHFREMPAALQAVRCEDCSGCTIRCPHGVNVARRLTRAQEVFA